jgi:PhoPQ-activated pathogenicity-related protein
MPIISVRLSEEERKTLVKYGPISKIVKESLKVFLNDKRRAETLKRLNELQRENVIKIKTEEDLRMIKEDRGR